MQKNEIVVTRSCLVLHGMNGSGFVIEKQHYEMIRKAITISKKILKSDKHNVVQISLNSWVEQKTEG